MPPPRHPLRHNIRRTVFAGELLARRVQTHRVDSPGFHRLGGKDAQQADSAVTYHRYRYRRLDVGGNCGELSRAHHIGHGEQASLEESDRQPGPRAWPRMFRRRGAPAGAALAPYLRRNSRPRDRRRANEGGQGTQKKRGPGAVEMPELWKAWKAEGRLPTLSTSPLGSLAKSRRDFHIPTAAVWKSGKPKAGLPISHPTSRP